MNNIPKIYASQINNLSDARYFAALNVDYLGFPIDGSISAETIKEIKDWLIGPTYIGELDALQLNPTLLDIIQQTEITKIKTSPFFNGSLPPEITVLSTHLDVPLNTSAAEFVLKAGTSFNNIPEEEKKRIKNICSKNKVWLDISFSPTEVHQMIEHLAPYGLIIKGGDEERPGFKSFDELDDIFEALELM